jgi:hypothetical protein
VQARLKIKSSRAILPVRRIDPRIGSAVKFPVSPS